MNKVTIETDTEIITGEFTDIHINIDYLECADYTLKNMNNVLRKTKKFQWNIMFYSNSFNEVSFYEALETKTEAKKALRRLFRQVVDRTEFFDGEKIILDNGHYYIDREQV